MTSPLKSIQQIIPGAGRYDAITQQALTFRRWLREKGLLSDIFAPHIEDDRYLEQEIKPLSSFSRSVEQGLLYHHSLGLPEIEPLIRVQPTILVYHNITPADFFAVSDPAQARRMQYGREQLHTIQPHVKLAIGDSAYNLTELEELGYLSRAVVPLAVESPTENPAAFLEKKMGNGIHILFIGRIVPNKRQEDLLHLLTHCRHIDPAAQLTLIGARESAGYDRWLTHLIKTHHLQSAVYRPGQLSDSELAAVWQKATVYVSMSEHEGFGKPLIESMGAGLPVVAFAATAVPETMGNAGILFFAKKFPVLAELISFLHEDLSKPFVERLLARQQKRAADFAPERVKQTFYQTLAQINWL